MVMRDLIYEGEWEEGKRQGQGLEYAVNQSFSYEGMFIFIKVSI